MEAFFRTGIHTFSAADTFRRAGDLADGQTYGAGLLADITGNAPFFFPVDLHKAEPIEPAVDSAKRAEVLAERAVDLYRKQEKGDKDTKLPEKQAAGLTAELSVHRKKRQCAQKCTGRTEVFAERRYSGKTAKQEQRAKSCKKKKNGIFSKGQNAVEGQSLFLTENRNPEKKILHHSKRT